jgi:hypothetical protein
MSEGGAAAGAAKMQTTKNPAKQLTFGVVVCGNTPLDYGLLALILLKK